MGGGQRGLVEQHGAEKHEAQGKCQVMGLRAAAGVDGLGPGHIQRTCPFA